MSRVRKWIWISMWRTFFCSPHQHYHWVACSRPVKMVWRPHWCHLSEFTNSGHFLCWTCGQCILDCTCTCVHVCVIATHLQNPSTPSYVSLVFLALSFSFLSSGADMQKLNAHLPGPPHPAGLLSVSVLITHPCLFAPLYTECTQGCDLQCKCVRMPCVAWQKRKLFHGQQLPCVPLRETPTVLFAHSEWLAVKPHPERKPITSSRVGPGRSGTLTSPDVCFPIKRKATTGVAPKGYLRRPGQITLSERRQSQRTC